MTSWSLTILFIHLWISAFIVLYFYSINQKSRLAAIFNYLFGPYSCSKINDDNSNKSKPAQKTNNDEDLPFFIRLYKLIFTKSATTQLSKLPNSNKNEPRTEIDDEIEPNNASEKSTPVEPIVVFVRSDDSPHQKNSPTKQQLKLKEPYLNEASTILLEENKTTETTARSSREKSKIKETYCVKKSECQYLSETTVGSTHQSEWIKSHVPGLVLVLIKISWMLYNQIVISCFVVTIGYFTYVWLTDLETEPTWLTEIGNLHRHGFNSIVAIIDIILVAYPVRIFHFLYTAIYGWLYALVTFLYWFQNPPKNIIYAEIDYSKPIAILGYYVSLTLLTFAMQIIHFFAYKFKLFIRYEYLWVRENCF